MNSVHVGDKAVSIRKGLRQYILWRDDIIGLEHKPLTGKVVFVTAKKRYKVVLWHGYRKIRRELGL